MEKDELAVGDSTRLEIIYSTKTYRGRQTKRPSITTNVGTTPMHVKITAEIVTNPEETFPIKIQPYKFDISQFGEAVRKKMKFTIANVSEEDLEIELVDMPYHMFKLKLPKKVKAGEEAEGEIEILDDWVGEQFEKSLTIQVSDNAHTRFTIPVRRMIRTAGTSTANVGGEGK